MKQYLGVGTYSEPILFGTGEVFRGKGKGLYICSFEKGKIETVSELKMTNPSFFCVDMNRRLIYAVNETKEFHNMFGGGITEIELLPDYSMKIISNHCTGGADPCHISLSPDRSFVAVSNFASGSVSLLKLSEEGHLVPPAKIYQHYGCSVHPTRQRSAHAHSVIFDCNGRLLVPDLGMDVVVIYDTEKGVLSHEAKKDICLKPGSGPRFGEFSSDLKHFYLINELSSTVTHFTVKNGYEYTEEETIPTLPSDFEGQNICSDLHITPDGNFLFASNRGHDSITVFYVDKQTGKLTLKERFYCGGKTPRNFCIDPEGKYIIVGNQDSDSITTFEIMEDGCISEVYNVEFPSPVCIKFLEF